MKGALPPAFDRAMRSTKGDGQASQARAPAPASR